MTKFNRRVEVAESTDLYVSNYENTYNREESYKRNEFDLDIKGEPQYINNDIDWCDANESWYYSYEHYFMSTIHLDTEIGDLPFQSHWQM